MKTTKTYSIEESIYKAFDSLTTERNINKSSFFEDIIRKFLKDNDMDFVDKLYSLITNPSYTATVISKDDNFYFLNDGAKIPVILFMQTFKECDSINPEKFFNKSVPIFENIVEKIKKIDESKISNGSTSLNTLFDKMKMNDYENKYGIEHLKEIRRKEYELLNEIDRNYKNGAYINMSKTELCEVILHVMQLNFSPGEKEYDLQQLLINILVKQKNSVPEYKF